MFEIDSLDATPYLFATNEYETQFENLILNIYSCYLYLLSNGDIIPENDENTIRDMLLSYLKNTKVRNEYCIIEGYRFDKEVDECEGRVDIKIVDINDFENHDAYYIIECKRVDGTNSLNHAYVEHGINRFITRYKSSKCKPYYSSYYGVNGMIGFVVKEIDIDKNMNKIGSFFNQIKKDKLYDSTHKSLKLYHLMMDFSKSINI
jgi:hypothetical protein